MQAVDVEQVLDVPALHTYDDNFGFSSEQREQLVEQCGAQQWLNMHRRTADDVVDVLVPSLEDAVSDRSQQRIVETSLV